MMFTRCLCFCSSGCAIPKKISIQHQPEPDEEEDVGLLHHSKDSFRRLEPPGLGWTNPIILVESSKEEVSILQDSEKQVSYTIRELTESGSFPADKCLKPSTPEHKQKEIWSFSVAETRVSSTGLISRRWDQLVLNRYQKIKHRIKHAFKEKRRSSYTGIISGSSRKATTSQDHDLSNGDLRVMRRASSLNESLDRYAQLFDYSFRKEPILQRSRSLRLSNEEKVLSMEHVPKIFRRISSLSDRESLGSVYLDTLASEMPIQSASNFEPREANSADIAEPGDPIDDVVEPETWGDSHDREQKNVVSINPRRELTLPRSDSCPESPDTPPSLDYLTSHAEHPNFEGSEINPQDHENDDYSVHSVSDKDDGVCSKYIRDVLELSGFTENEFLEMCYLPDQPLHHSLYKELETSFEKDDRSCYHHLLYDLVNEAFSYSPSIFQSPKGHNVMQEVTAKVSRILEFKPDPDQTLDDIVCRDLAKDSRINLQKDAEFVALDLENMIFDKLLDEIFYL